MARELLTTTYFVNFTLFLPYIILCIIRTELNDDLLLHLTERYCERNSLSRELA